METTAKIATIIENVNQWIDAETDPRKITLMKQALAGLNSLLAIQPPAHLKNVALEAANAIISKLNARLNELDCPRTKKINELHRSGRITNKERDFLFKFSEVLLEEPGFSDVELKDIEFSSMQERKGILGSLVKKGLLETHAMDCDWETLELIYPAGELYGPFYGVDDSQYCEECGDCPPPSSTKEKAHQVVAR
jgi:hypothetical protein